MINVECRHHRDVTSGCPDCFHNSADRSIHEDILEICRAQLGAMISGASDAGRPRFRSVEKSNEDIQMALDEIIYITEELKEAYDARIQEHEDPFSGE